MLLALGLRVRVELALALVLGVLALLDGLALAVPPAIVAVVALVLRLRFLGGSGV